MVNFFSSTLKGMTNKSFTLKKLLQKGNFVSIRSRNLQVLATEICKSIYQLSPAIMQGKFRLIENIICGEICESRPFRTQKQKLWHVSSAIPEKSQDW